VNMVIPNEGKVVFLFICLCAQDDSFIEDFWIELFQNDVTVNDLSILGDFTAASFDGYDRIAQTRSDFNTSEAELGYAITQNLASPSWTCTGGAPQTVYGWIMYGQTTNIVYAGQNFDAPRVMSPGAKEDISPFDFRLKTLV
jgi:hypothetical protein